MLRSNMQRLLGTMRWLAVAGVASIGCGAPKAAPIGGDISSVIARGMADGTSSFDHRVWDELLSKYAKNGGRRFDYAGLEQEEARFDEYLTSLAEVDLASLARNELEALFINAYNAYTVRTILNEVGSDGSYGIESIRDIDDVFGRPDHLVGGFRLSLDNIEHNILRPIFQDPRLHFSVNCASISCPPLPPSAFRAEDLDERLDEATRSTLQNPDYVAVEDRELVLTKILEWYGSDFTNESFRGSEASVAAFVRKYARDDVREFIDSHADAVPIRFRDYDWRLNRWSP